MSCSQKQHLNFLQKTLILPIKFYQYAIRPYLGERCRFHPSCSCYSEQAIACHGIAKGLYLTMYRILRCHPFCKGGFDPVPDEVTCKKIKKSNLSKGKL